MTDTTTTPEVAPTVPADEPGSGTADDAVDRAFATVEAAEAEGGDMQEALDRLKGGKTPEDKGGAKPKPEAKPKADTKAKADAPA